MVKECDIVRTIR